MDNKELIYWMRYCADQSNTECGECPFLKMESGRVTCYNHMQLMAAQALEEADGQAG